MPIRPMVSGVLATWMVTKSDWRGERVEVDQVDVHLAGPLGRDERVVGDQPHPERHRPLGDELADAAEADDAERLVRRARRPPTSSAPTGPATSAAWAWGTLRACASSRAMVCSAAERMFDCGALTTITPRRVAASTSTLSRPMPARPTTTRSRAGRQHLGGDRGGRADDEGVGAGDPRRAAPRGTGRGPRRRRGRRPAAGRGHLRRSSR